MPVYLFTLHAYRSWNADRRQGFVQRKRGKQLPNEALARHYNAVAVQEPVVFRLEHQRILTNVAREVCMNLNWDLYAAATDPSHVHYLIGWRSFVESREVARRLKNILSRRLGQALETPGRRWFVKHHSRRRVRAQSHFDHLVDAYLPDHRGLVWTYRVDSSHGETRGEPPADAGG